MAELVGLLGSYLGALALVGMGFGLAIHLQKRRFAYWRAAAEAVGVTDLQPGSMGMGCDLTGVWRERRVSLEIVSGGRYQPSKLRMMLRGTSTLNLRPEVTGLPDEPSFGIFEPAEIQIGDQAFDNQLYVAGPEETLHAVLDAETRLKLRELIGGYIPLPGRPRGALRAEVVIKYGDAVADFGLWQREVVRTELGGVLQALGDVLGRLEFSGDRPRRILENQVTEPEGRVRLENLRFLTTRYRRHPAVAEAVKRACADENEDVQLFAALRRGGAEGLALLTDIASREWSSDGCASQAVKELGRRLPRERLHAILSHALRTHRVETAVSCMESLARSADAEAISAIVRVLAVEQGRLAQEAVRALGLSGLAAAEAPLLVALGRPEIKLGAISALGQVGTARAVPSLKDAEGGLFDATFKRAARQAIAEIQSRLHGASPGQLSLATDAQGQLSMADEDPRGRVSFPDGDRLF